MLRASLISTELKQVDLPYWHGWYFEADVVEARGDDQGSLEAQPW